MSPHDEEDYELVLGNRQLFFLAIVLFGVFFSIGYTVGYSRGHDTAKEVASAADTSEAAPAAAPVLPAAERASHSSAKSTEAVYSGAPTSSEPAPPRGTESSALRPKLPAGDSPAATRANPGPLAHNSLTPAANSGAMTPKAAAVKPAPAAAQLNTTSNPAPAARPSTTLPANSAVRETKPAPPRAEGPSSASKSSSSPEPAPATPTVTVPEIEPGTMYLQVLASRDAEPARKALFEFKAKGHPVTLDNQDPGWYRILVGPFPTRADANAYQARLQAEGIKSFLRRF